MKVYELPYSETERTDRTSGNVAANAALCIVRIGKRHAQKVGIVAGSLPLQFNRKAPESKDERAVSAFTRESQMRAMWTFEDVLGGIGWQDFITLTYHQAPKDGKETKVHLKRLLEKVGRIAKASQIKAFWWLEFQSRGAIHFHIALAGVVRRFKEEPGPRPGFHWKGKRNEMVLCGNSAWLCREWTRIIGQENPDTLKHSARWEQVRSLEALPCYLSKYLAKKEQKTVPDCVENIGRFWGTHGCAVEKAAARGYERVIVPAALLAGTSETFGAGACPFRFQWNQAETLREWAASEEGRAVQEQAKEAAFKHHCSLFTNGIYRNDRGEKMDCIIDADKVPAAWLEGNEWQDVDS